MNLSAEPGKGWQVLSGIGWAVGLLAVLYLGLAVAAATQTPQPWIDIALNSAACGAVVAGAAWGIRYARKPRRAGQWSQRKAREARREFFRRKASSFALVLLGYIALTGVGLFLLPWPSLAFRQGCLVVGLLWLLSWLFSMDNAEGQRMGALAERWTSERFRRLPGAGWRVVDRVVFEEGDVDHVGFGPDGVVAVETKYSATRAGSTDQAWPASSSRPAGEPGRSISCSRATGSMWRSDRCSSCGAQERKHGRDTPRRKELRCSALPAGQIGWPIFP